MIFFSTNNILKSDWFNNILPTHKALVCPKTKVLVIYRLSDKGIS